MFACLPSFTWNAARAMVKDWPAFVRTTIRGSRVRTNGQLPQRFQGCGPFVPTIKSHYQLLEDMFSAPPAGIFRQSAQKPALDDRFLFFDLGIRHAAAGCVRSPISCRPIPARSSSNGGRRTIRKAIAIPGRGRTSLTPRTHDGAEVDFIIAREASSCPLR